MAMVMTGRVLLVCALCVLWCGAGGIHARDRRNNARGGCVTSGVFEGKALYLSSGCHKTALTLPLRSALPTAAVQADDREQEGYSTEGHHSGVHGKLGAGGGGSPLDSSSPGDTFLSSTPLENGVSTITDGASTPQKNNSSGAGGHSDTTLSSGPNMDALKTSKFEGNQESMNIRDKAADSFTDKGKSKNVEEQGRRATEVQSPDTSVIKISPPQPQSPATQQGQAPTSEGPPSVQITNEAIKPEDSARGNIARVQTITPLRPEVEGEEVETEPVGKTPGEKEKGAKAKRGDEKEQKEKDDKEQEQPQVQQQQQLQPEREEKVPPLASPLGAEAAQSSLSSARSQELQQEDVTAGATENLEERIPLVSTQITSNGKSNSPSPSDTPIADGTAVTTETDKEKVKSRNNAESTETAVTKRVQKNENPAENGKEFKADGNAIGRNGTATPGDTNSSTAATTAMRSDTGTEEAPISNYPSQPSTEGDAPPGTTSDGELASANKYDTVSRSAESTTAPITSAKTNDTTTSGD
ncbi:mucin-associated surface protein (MASP), putative, partial [Trypanosoma cruzi marinkellei]